MTIAWGSFLVVVVASLLSALLVVTMFSFALRLGDHAAPWRRPVSIALYAGCVIAVLIGIWIIVSS